jgi:hypothetical protein
LPLFYPDGFVDSLEGRDPELILAIHAISLRFGRSPAGSDLRPYIGDCARRAHSLVMERVGRGSVELSTLQTLCLLAMFDFTCATPRSHFCFLVGTDMPKLATPYRPGCISTWQHI